MTRGEKRRDYMASFREAHREDAKAYQAVYYEEHKDDAKAYYAVHRDERRAYKARYDAAHREEKRAYMESYNAAHKDETRDRLMRKQAWFLGNLRILRAAQGCEDCGTSEGTLDHHHLDPATKRCTVSSMYGYSLDAFLDEIAKCTVLCSSCHKGRHVKMRALAAQLDLQRVKNYRRDYV